MGNEKEIDADMTEKVLENQLHKQYAENENSRGNILISFIVGIIALFGFYGYVYLHITKPIEESVIPLLEFTLFSIFVVGILFFLSVLSLYLGYSIRRDQIIVCRIRRKRFGRDGEENINKHIYNEIFRSLYKPCGHNWFNFLLDFYNLFYWLFLVSELFVIYTFFMKYYSVYGNINICNCFDTKLAFIFHIIFVLLTLILRCCYFKKYKKNSVNNYKCLFARILIFILEKILKKVNKNEQSWECNYQCIKETGYK